MDTETRSTFKQVLPVLLPTFVNKSVDIGMRIFPMLLLERGFSPEHSSLILGIARSSLLVATFLGGMLSDRFGARNLILFAFLLSAISMGTLPNMESWIGIAVFAALVQLAQGMIQGPARMFLTQNVDKNRFKEAFAWMASSNNLAVMVGMIFVYFASGLGLKPLYYVDGCTSAVAFLVGFFAFPKRPAVEVSADTPKTSALIRAHFPRPLLLITGITFLYMFCYEAFSVLQAVKTKHYLQNDGIRLFSSLYIFNTLACAGLTVYVAKWVTNVPRSLLWGLAATVTALAIMVLSAEHPGLYWLSETVITAGELVFRTMSQIVLFHYLPGGRKDGAVYGISLSLQLVGKVLGSSLGMLAFGNIWIGWMLVIGAFVSAAILLMMFWPNLRDDFRS